jgi:RimJ/RimL family protein N-acetyltransferase
LIETERLVLSRITLDDVDDMVALHADPEVLRFIPTAGAYDRTVALESVQTDEHDWIVLGRRRLIARERESGRFVGRIMILDWPQFGESEVGWVLAPDARGHGYATEAGRAAQDWAFEHLQIPYVIALIRPENDPSIAVAERLGMAPLRSDELSGVPITVYAISRESAAAR